MSSQPLPRRWVMFGVIYLCSLSFAVALQSVPPLLGLIVSDFQSSYGEVGLLMGLFSLCGIVIAIPAGIISDRYSQKLLGIIAFILVIGGQVLFAFGGSLLVLAIGRVITGGGAIALTVLLPQTLARWFGPRGMGLPMGIFSTGMPVGTIVALNLMSVLGQDFGWRNSILFSLVLTVIGLIVFALLFAMPPGGPHPETARRESPLRGLKVAGKPIWLLGTSWMMFNGSMIALFTFTPEFLVKSGFSASNAGLMTSAVMWPPLVVGPLVGQMMTRWGHKSTMIIAGGIVLAGLVAAVPFAFGWMLALMLIIGIVQTFVPAPTMSTAPELVPPERLGLGYGIVSTCMNIGILAGPPLAGYARDVTGGFTASYAVMAVVALAGALVVLPLRRGGRAAG